MEKMSRHRLTDKMVKIDNIGGSVDEVSGVVTFENDKGIYLEDTKSLQTVFVPWTSIAVLKILND
jgi:hypothetical protein